MSRPDFEALAEAKRAADQALADAEEHMVAEYEQARDAYAAAPGSDKKRDDFKAMSAALVRYRQVQREGRDGLAVVGDAFRAPEQNEG